MLTFLISLAGCEPLMILSTGETRWILRIGSLQPPCFDGARPPLPRWIDADAAHRARLCYACFDNFGDDPQTYGYAAGFGLRPSCEDEAVSLIIDLQHSSLRYAHMDGLVALERFFDAEQNARVVKDAEEYYRTMFHESVSSWNLRDQHMVETLRRFEISSIFDILLRRWSSGRIIRMSAMLAPLKWSALGNGI